MFPLTPGRFSIAPFAFNHSHDFHRHPRFFGFPSFILYPWPTFYGFGYVSGPYVSTVPYSPYAVPYSPYAVPYDPYAYTPYSYSPYDTWTTPNITQPPRSDVDPKGFDRQAPFDPTPEEVVDRMLALAGVHKGDLVYDLGTGDGRVVIAAAKKYGVKAVGFEMDRGLAKLARENVRKQGVESLVEIRERDFMNADVSPATVVTLYLSQEANLMLRSKLLKELRPEARVVSYTFDMGDWQPKVVETYRDAGGDRHVLYLWQMSKPLVFSDTNR
jgi:precorrin-6B methylase 2